MAPVKQRLLAIDPGWLNGCKMAVLEKNGEYFFFFIFIVPINKNSIKMSAILQTSKLSELKNLTSREK